MVNTHLGYLDLSIHKLSGTDSDQDAESFIQLMERNINFALGDAPGDAGELANYISRKKVLLFVLLRGPTADWCENNITWDNVGTTFTIRFSDGQNKFRYRMEVEHCIRGDGEEFRNFLLRIKRTVDKGWPAVMEGNPQQTMVQKKLLRHGKDDKDILTTQWKDSDLDTYNQKHKNIWWKTQMLRGTKSPLEQFRETWLFKSPLTSSTMKNRPKPKWLHWDKKWKTYDRNYKNIGLMM